MTETFADTLFVTQTSWSTPSQARPQGSEPTGIVATTVFELPETTLTELDPEFETNASSSVGSKTTPTGSRPTGTLDVRPSGLKLLFVSLITLSVPSSRDSAT